jgi:hypothetical protein
MPWLAQVLAPPAWRGHILLSRGHPRAPSVRWAPLAKVLVHRLPLHAYLVLEGHTAMEVQHTERVACFAILANFRMRQPQRTKPLVSCVMRRLDDIARQDFRHLQVQSVHRVTFVLAPPATKGCAQQLQDSTAPRIPGMHLALHALPDGTALEARTAVSLATHHPAHTALWEAAQSRADRARQAITVPGGLLTRSRVVLMLSQEGTAKKGQLHNKEVCVQVGSSSDRFDLHSVLVSYFTSMPQACHCKCVITV